MKETIIFLVLIIIMLSPTFYGIFSTKEVTIEQDSIGIRIDENNKIDSVLLSPGTYFISKKDKIVKIPYYDVVYKDSIISITFNNVKIKKDS